MKGQFQYIDFHTHRIADDAEVFSLYNQIIGQQEEFKLLRSSGIHPWYVSKENAIELKQILSELAYTSEIMAIGECGLDKVCSTPMEIQTDVLRFQIDLANQSKKPLIIHCVRAYQEVTSLLKSMDNSVPVIFHGFNKHYQLANELLNAGYYISFGKSLYHERTQHVLTQCPINRIFLETDGEPFSVKELYKTASEVLGLPVSILQTRILQNFKNITSIHST